MWKVKLDDNLWLADGISEQSTTTNEAYAWLLPDIPTVQEQLEKACRFKHYPKAMVIAEFNQAQDRKSG